MKKAGIMAIYFQSQSLPFPINENQPDRDAVIIGDLTSTGPIHLRFRNVVIMGSVRSFAGSVTVEAVDNAFHFGTIKCEGRGDATLRGKTVYTRDASSAPELTTVMLDKMRSLGICFTQISPTTFRIE
jgi:hypothetical protein